MSPVLGVFAVALVEVVLAVAVWARSSHRSVNRRFSAFAAAVALWGTISGLFYLIVHPAANLIIGRTAFAAAALIPVTFFRFAAVFPKPGRLHPASVQGATLIGLFICGLAFSPWIVADVPAPSQARYGPLHPVFAVYFLGCFAWALVHLARKLRQAKGFARAQLQYLFLGTALATLGGVTTNLVVPLLFGPSRSSLYGPYFTLIWVGFTAHSIIRHRLMDIRVVISRLVAYAAGWALTAGLLVGGGVFLTTVVLHEDPALSPAVAVALGLVAALCFAALGPRMKRLADRYLYRPAYDGRQLVRDGSRAMGTVAGPERVAEAMGQLITKAYQLESLAIAAWHREREEFQPTYTHHVDAAFAWPGQSLAASAPLVKELRNGAGTLLADDLTRRAPSREVGAVAGNLRAWSAEIAVPVVGDRELIAIILAGPKLSGDPFYRDDLELLETLASQLAIGLKNAHLYHEVVSIKEYNERILAHMDSGVVAVRDDGVVTTFNPGAERITGLAATAVIDRSLGLLDPAVQGILKDSLAGQQDTEKEIAVTHPDGRTLPLLIHTSALHDRNGQIRGAIAVFNDHSRLKALEEDKRRTDRLAAVGALATGIAHEIRNPLVAIKTFAELLPERADDQEFRSTFAKVAVKEIHRIEELLARLRALAVPTASSLRPLDLGVPIGETLDLLRGEADRRRVRVITDIEPELPGILGEPDQLKQLFLNLFLNGLEAMATGGTLAVTVRADLERHGRRLVTVRVADTGAGIPPEDLPRVFEPFFTTKTHGTGLGLAICRGIADAHRAALWAELGPGGLGTTFVIQFPTLTAAPLAEAIR